MLGDMRTIDLLGGGDFQREIDLEVRLPPPHLSLSGWERRLDKKVYYGTASSADSSGQDLNLPITASADGRGKEMEKWKEKERGSLKEHDFMGRDGEENDLLPTKSCEWKSMSTQNKVKMALERAKKQSGLLERSIGSKLQQACEEEARMKIYSISTKHSMHLAATYQKRSLRSLIICS